MGSKPYQNKAIIDILHDFLFGPHSTVSAVTRNHFDPAEPLNRFPPSTVALAATAVSSCFVCLTKMLTICRFVQALMNGAVAGAYLCFSLRTPIQTYTTIM